MDALRSVRSTVRLTPRAAYEGVGKYDAPSRLKYLQITSNQVSRASVVRGGEIKTVKLKRPLDGGPWTKDFRKDLPMPRLDGGTDSSAGPLPYTPEITSTYGPILDA